jgi:hypothetical protein
MTKQKIACFLFAVCLSAGGPARADDLLIWAPARTADRSYKATVGFRLPMAWETSAGADVALASTKGGALLPDSEQATLWGKIAKANVTPAGRSERDVSLRVDTLRGSGQLMLSRSRNWILSDSLDMQSSRSISIGYDAAETRQAAVTVSQALKLIHPWTGTSLSVNGSLDDVNGDFSSTVAVSQNILPTLNVNASLTDPLSADRTGNVGLSYRLRW